eukprot:14567333-Ditylum_brightwellii.AAC.2
MARGCSRRSGYEEVTGNTQDISQWLAFEFNDLVWWHDRAEKPNISDDPKHLGRWVGISNNVGSNLCYWIVTASGKLVSKTSVQHVTT